LVNLWCNGQHFKRKKYKHNYDGLKANVNLYLTWMLPSILSPFWCGYFHNCDRGPCLIFLRTCMLLLTKMMIPIILHAKFQIWSKYILRSLAFMLQNQEKKVHCICAVLVVCFTSQSCLRNSMHCTLHWLVNCIFVCTSCSQQLYKKILHTRVDIVKALVVFTLTKHCMTFNDEHPVSSLSFHKQTHFFCH
jgi:hypothetical protein